MRLIVYTDFINEFLIFQEIFIFFSFSCYFLFEPLNFSGDLIQFLFVFILLLLLSFRFFLSIICISLNFLDELIHHCPIVLKVLRDKIENSLFWRYSSTKNISLMKCYLATIHNCFHFFLTNCRALRDSFSFLMKSSSLSVSSFLL